MLVGAEGQNIKVQLPGKLTVRDIDWLSVWCITFRENFGHILIPKDAVKDVPPALGQNTLKVGFTLNFSTQNGRSDPP